MIERFLKPIGMEFMAKAFMENKISGPVLMALTEDHIKEMGCAVLGMGLFAHDSHMICTCFDC